MLTLIPGALARFLADDDGKPFVMLNLLRFKPEGGRERYAEYLAVADPIVARFGGEIVYHGDGFPPLSAEDGQAWDAVALVKYPSRRAFGEMVKDPEYRQKAGPMRASALVDAALQPMRTVAS